MSFGFKKSFGRMCKEISNAQFMRTGLRPREFSELFRQMLLAKEEEQHRYRIGEGIDP